MKHINYPFMTSDGETFFFAAKADDGLGGYDIFMTRYDPDEGKFFSQRMWDCQSTRIATTTCMLRTT